MIASGGKSWFSAAELAELALPGLPRVKRKINERADAERWKLKVDSSGAPLARLRAGRGGGLEYHVSLLPQAARMALAKEAMASEATITAALPPASLWPWYEVQNAKTKAEAERRAKIVAAVDRLDRSGLTRAAAVAVAADEHGVSSSTLWSWLRLVSGIDPNDRLPHLAPRRKGGGVAVEVDPGAFKFIQSDYLRPEKPAWEECYYRLQREYAAPRGIALPCSRTLWRKFERETPAQLVVLKRGGEDALRQLTPALKRSVAELTAMELVNIDGHDVDVFVRWEDGRIGRPTWVAIQDVYSRKFLAGRIAETEDSITARLAFADLFRDWGIPKGLLADNGHAFASKWITGGIPNRYRFKVRDDEPTGLLTALGIEVVWALPYRGSSKPIERGFKDFCGAGAKHPAFAGAYTGNSPMAKPDNYGNRAIPIAEFRRIWAEIVRAHNEKPGRDTEMGRGIYSFDQVFEASYAVAPIGKATPEQLRMALLTPDEKRCDPKTGAIELFGNRYWEPELMQIAGERVIVRFDPDDLHTEIHVYSRDGRFLMTAGIHDAVGFRDAEAAKRRGRQIADVKKAAKMLEKAENLLSAEQLFDLMPNYHDEQEIAPAPTPSVIRPVRHRGHTAAALKAISEPSQEPARPATIDRLAAAANRLRLVD